MKIACSLSALLFWSLQRKSRILFFVLFILSTFYFEYFFTLFFWVNFLSTFKSASPFLSTFLSAVFFLVLFWVLFFPLSGDPNLYASLRAAKKGKVYQRKKWVDEILLSTCRWKRFINLEDKDFTGR